MALFSPRSDSLDENSPIRKSDDAELAYQVAARGIASAIEIGVPAIERSKGVAAYLGGNRGFCSAGWSLDLTERSVSCLEIHLGASTNMPDDRDGLFAREWRSFPLQEPFPSHAISAAVALGSGAARIAITIFVSKIR